MGFLQRFFGREAAVDRPGHEEQHLGPALALRSGHLSHVFSADIFSEKDAFLQLPGKT